MNFRQGSAENIPLKNKFVDFCIVPELLEHVADWEKCLDEFSRILKPNGILFISTTNKLCPVQNEFNLPFYSWYPDFLKKKYEKLAVTSRPEIVNFAKFPAVNWFTVFQLGERITKKIF